MKRRKKPILLVTILVVLLGAVVVMSMPPGGFSPKPPPGSDVTGQKGEAPSADAVAGDMKKHLTAPQAAASLDQPKGPSIAVHKSELGYEKPKPVQGGTTESGWYYR